jgi:hypothetical protein
MMFQLLLCTAAFLSYLRFAVLVIRKRPWLGVISCLITTLYITCLFIPAQLQASGELSSKLLAPSVLSRPYPSEVESLSSNWLLELLAVHAAEFIASFAYMFSRRGKRALAGLPLKHLSTERHRAIVMLAALLLLSVGIVASIVLPAGSVAQRGQDVGEGLSVILRTTLVVSIATLAFNNFFRKKLIFVITIAGVCFLVLSNVRSPLLVVILAYAAGVIARRELSFQKLAGFGMLSILFALAGSFMSAYRGEMIQGRTPEASAVWRETMRDPLVAAYGSGIDTLDGYRLSAKVYPGETPDPANLVVAVTTFVPRAIWPTKPMDLSISISARYLKYGAGGAFLSPIGYLTIAFGGYVEALLVWAVLIFVISLLYMINFESFIGAVFVIMTFRLTLAGSPFDVYYSLTLIMIYALGCLPALIFYSTVRGVAAPREQRRAPIHTADLQRVLDQPPSIKEDL